MKLQSLSRTFNAKMFTPILISGRKIYGSLQNMLNTAVLKPFIEFDLSTAKVLYVLVRMPTAVKNKLTRAKIELAIASWFADKANLQSLYITEPVYTDEQNDRVDVALLLGGFDTAMLLSKLEKKVEPLKNEALERGFIEESWQKIKLPIKPKPLETIQIEAPQPVEQKEPAELEILHVEPPAHIETATAQAPQTIQKPKAKPKKPRTHTKKTQT